MNFGDDDPENPQNRVNSGRHSKPSTAVYASASTPPLISEKKEGIVHAILHLPWNTLFIIACALAVSLDPLFFYIPIINEERKCLEMDSTLKTSALVLRSVMDMTFLLHILYQIFEAVKKPDNRNVKPTPKPDNKNAEPTPKSRKILKKEDLHSLLTDILCLLPIPQVLLVVVFFRLKGNGYLNQRKVLSFFLLLQYIARIYRIFLSSQKFSRSAGIKVKGLFNLFLYIIFSHVFGAIWYFFAIQRETSCWHRACGKDCASSFYCNEDDLHSNKINDVISRINSTCHLNGTFDYGIFKDAISSQNTTSTKFIEKLFYCFWWGLRNLSNFGTNLSDTSNYPWENCFAVLVSISGLVLFLYVIGNVQTYMQMRTSKLEGIRVKIDTKGKIIREWMEKNCVPKYLMDDVITNVNRKFEENKDVDLENLFDVLPWHTREDLKRHLCKEHLHKIATLKRMDEKTVKKICEYMKPVTYPANEVFVQAGSRVDRMILITEGELWVDGNSGVKNHEKGDFYGAEQLLGWAAPKTPPSRTPLSFDDLPAAPETARCHTKVQGFVLSASDLKAAVHKCRHSREFNDNQLDH